MTETLKMAVSDLKEDAHVIKGQGGREFWLDEAGLTLRSQIYIR